MPRRTTPTLTEALAAYLRLRSAHCSDTTLTNDRCHISRFITTVGDRQTHLLTQAVVEDWMVEEAHRTAPTSYNKARSRLRGFLAFCARREWLPNDLMEEVPTRRAVRRERMRLSAAQLVALVENTTNERDRGLLAVACGTGLRSGDLTKMRVSDVDLGLGVIRVVTQKTGVSDELPITAETDAGLRRWLTEYARLLALTGEALEPGMLLFPSTTPRKSHQHGEIYRRPLPYQQLTHTSLIVHKALRRIGVESTHQEGMHTLRRSVGRIVFDRASEAGHDSALRIAGSLLGHASVATTQIYLGVDPDRRRRDELLRGQVLLAAPDENVVQMVARS